VVYGADALVHLAPIAPDLPAGAADQELLDLATRGTYVLLQAAVAAGVRRVVLGSTLALMERYPASWAVSETWRPQPDVTDVAQLAAYLAEVSAQQFAHVEPLQVVCLRFGSLVDAQTSAGLPYDTRWLHVDDAVQAVVKALTAPLASRTQMGRERRSQGWWVCHIPGGGQHGRWPLAEAAEEHRLGYRPMHTFADWPGERCASGSGNSGGTGGGPGAARPTPARPVAAHPQRRHLWRRRAAGCGHGAGAGACLPLAPD